MLRNKIPVFFLLIAMVAGGLLGVMATKFSGKEEAKVETVQPEVANDGCSYTISRMNGYKNIHPVYMAEPACESKNYLSLKAGIIDYIESIKSAGELESASVYVKDLNGNEWMDVNPENTYHPGSLFKVITMITFLKMAENNMSILDQQVKYDQVLNPPMQTFNSKVIQPGNTYKIKDLIYYMVVYSDNHATMLLHKYMDPKVFENVFTDLGLAKPNIYENTYQLSVKDYSKLVSVLYDGAYLSDPASDFAISLLCESDFALGLTKELPKSIKIAHKFGEAGKPGNRELHESAIVYLNNRPYLVTIMTKGKQSEKLAEMMARISKMVYDHMASSPV
jgi:beta-lactamase class A